MKTVTNLGRTLSNRALLSPSMEGYVGEKYRLSFREVNERSNRFAAFLKKNNVSYGDRIAILCKNNERATTAMFAAAKIGIITVFLNWRLVARELAYVLSDCGASLLLYDGEFSEIVNQIRGEIPAKIFVGVGNADAEQDEEFEDILCNMPAEEPEITGGGEDPAVILYTSGTTGRPKGVILTHNNCFWVPMGHSYTIEWRHNYRFLCVSPLFHVGGLAPIMTNVAIGCTTVFVPNFDPAKVCSLITTEKINLSMTAPAMLQFMLMVPGIDKMDFSSVKHILCGGSAVPQSLIETYNNLGIEISQVYGITEYSGAVTFWSHDMGVEKSDSMGKPVFYGLVKICGPDSEEEMPAGEVGEICCAGPQVFKGYWNNSEATDEVLKNGYYRSGDLGKKDEDGFVYVVDRLKDMIVSGSENIYPAELELDIRGHPGVAEVAVVGKADNKWGEIPVAFVVTRQGKKVSEQDIIDICRKNLAGYKRVKEVRFVDSLPKNALMKVLKQTLRNQLK